jgi:hypothetical protein
MPVILAKYISASNIYEKQNYQRPVLPDVVVEKRTK